MTRRLATCLIAALSLPALVAADRAIPVRSLPANRQCLPPADLMVWVAGGETRIGDDEGYADERPSYTAPVKGFWIDRTEVTNRQFAAFVAATGHVTTAERRGDSFVFVPPAAGTIPTAPDQWWRIVQGADWRHPQGPESRIDDRLDEPVVHVSQADARAYARWRGHRLPSEEEYERAAQGRLGTLRDQPAPDSANSWQGPFPHEDLKLDGAVGIAPVGCYKANAYGAHDLIGNVWEWTSSWYTPGHGPEPSVLGAGSNPSADPRQPDKPVRVIKGGSFLCAPNYCARYRPAARHAQAEDETASHIGFRTASNRDLNS